MTGFSLGFDVEDEHALDVAEPLASSPVRASHRVHPPRTLTQPDISTSMFACRVRHFLAGLNPQRRAEIARRPRMYRLPWLRRSDEPDSDDFSP